jgi:hypothetical protein
MSFKIWSELKEKINANLEVGSDVDTKISFGISCRQMNRHVGVVIIHCINMLVVVLEGTEDF